MDHLLPNIIKIIGYKTRDLPVKGKVHSDKYGDK